MNYQPLPASATKQQWRAPTDERPTSEVTLALSHPQGASERRIDLRITDDASNHTIVDISLTPEEFADLMSSRVIRVAARIPDPVQASRLFREREQDSRQVPQELGHKSDYRNDESKRAAIDAWAQDIQDSEGWDEHSVQTGSQSFYATFRRWAPR